MVLINIEPTFKTLLAPLTADELQLLEDSIKAEGCRDPLVVWEGHDILVDGHNRYGICTRLGVPFEVSYLQFDDDKAVHNWIINNQLARRNVTPEQASYLRGKRYLAEKKGIGAPSGNNNAKKQTHQNDVIVSTSQILAQEYKVSKPTIERDAQFARSVDTLATQLGDDIRDDILQRDSGFTKKDVAILAKVVENEPEQVKQIVELVKSGEAKSVQDADKELRKQHREKIRNEMAQTAKQIKPNDRWLVRHADMRDYSISEPCDFIITDPPYLKEYLELYEILAIRASEWLKPNGLLIAMAGQSYLDQIYESMSRHLTYYWTAAYLTPGQPTPLRQRQVNTTWKPLLIFSNGDYNGKIFGDVFKSDGNDKSVHHWGQSESGMYDIVSKVCLSGQRIFDPFLGAGTTGVAALRHGCLFEGIDIDETNVGVSTKRLSEVLND